MSKNHFPGANRTIQYWAGKFVGSTMNTNCACIHTTETTVWPGYGSGASAPHMTVLPNIRSQSVTIRQHFPAGMSSRALVNLTGGVETNTQNVFQIELIGTCDSRYREYRKEWGTAGVDYIYWPDAPDWLLHAIAPIFRWLDNEWPNFKIQDAAPRGWVRYPDSYGASAPQRMTNTEWRNAYGIFGHQHVPENTHGDPGNFPIAKLIKFATGVITTPDPVPDPPKPPTRVTAVWGKPDTWRVSSIGPDVTRLGQQLEKWAKHYGLPAPYTVGPGPEFTEVDRRAVEAFQQKQGWTGSDADGFPGAETFKRLEVDPPSKPNPPTAEFSKPHEYISANLADYDTVGIGKATAELRARTTIPAYLLPKRPEWFHFQECSASTLDEMDKAFKEYKRVPAGGKGRESLYRTDAGITIIAAELVNVTHMLRKDTKEFLLTAWRDAEGFEGVYANFHNENEGSTVQILQFADVMKAAVAFAKKHGVDTRNIVITGDANTTKVRAYAKLRIYWRESRDIAKKKIDLTYKTTNRWKRWNAGGLVKGAAIDVDVFNRNAVVEEAEMLFGLISDHWAHRCVHRLFK